MEQLDFFDEPEGVNSWEEEWRGMPSYDNVFEGEPEVTVVFKFRTREDFEKFNEIIKDALFDGEKPFDGNQLKHRLNATSHWKDFLSKCDQLYKIRQDFIVWITDDQNIQEVEALQKPYIYVKKIPSSSYGYVMSKCHFAVCNHKGYATWNMAILDTFYNGCFTLVPEDGVFPSMFMGGSRGIYHNRKNLVEIMDEYLNKNESILKSMAKRIVDKNPALFNNNEGAIATELIHTGISNKMAKSTPEKYDEVMQLIEAGIMMSKGEIVNDLWSFHVNSNFQKIRWKLLEDGVKDDTSQSVTIYSKDEIEPTLPLKQLSF